MQGEGTVRSFPAQSDFSYGNILVRPLGALWHLRPTGTAVDLPTSSTITGVRGAEGGP